MNRRSFITLAPVAVSTVASVITPKTTTEEAFPTIEDFRKLAGEHGIIWSCPFIDFVAEHLPKCSRMLTHRPMEAMPQVTDAIETSEELFCFDMKMTPERALEQWNDLLRICYDNKVVAAEVHTTDMSCGPIECDVIVEGKTHRIPVPVIVDNSRRNKVKIFFKPRA